MAFHYSRRKLKPKEEGETGELNIVPYLDILMNLIMFMLLSITGLATFGVLNVTAPSYGASVSNGQDEKPKLLLSVLISKKGFFVAATGAVLANQSGSAQASTNGAPTIPVNPDGTYDYAKLTSQMLAVKKEFPTERSVIVGAESDVQYETLVQTMDAIREAPGPDKRPQELFSEVTLAAM